MNLINIIREEVDNLFTNKLYMVFESKYYYSTNKEILFIGTYDECVNVIQNNRHLNLEMLPYSKNKNVEEEFQVDNDILNITKPFDTIKKYVINNKTVYTLFGNVDYYENKEAILAIKGKSNQLTLNKQTYTNFLDELKYRFYAIPELSDSDLLVSIQTSANINDDIMRILQKPYIKDGFKKINPLFKMRDVKLKDRANITNLFVADFNVKENAKICIVDDFITTGTSFKNAFEILPNTVKSVGMCLFKLES